MRRTIFDLLDTDLDFKVEYNRLYDMLTSKYYVNNNDTYEEAFDECIELWKYRGSRTSFEEIITDLTVSDTYEEACLYLCEFALNIRDFLICYFLKEEFGVVDGTLYEEQSCIQDKMLYDNIMLLLDKLGYTYKKVDKDKIIVIINNADAIETALVVELKLADLILSYNDYKIVDDVRMKKNILKGMADYIEADKNKIKQLNDNLYKQIAMALNNFDIRHNNTKGNNAKEYVKNLKTEELLELYDKTYFLMLIAFRLEETNNIVNEFKKLGTELDTKATV